MDQSIYRHTPAGLCSRRAMVTLPPDWRKRRARLAPRSSRWSEPLATLTRRRMIAPLCCSIPRKDAQVQLYHFRCPGQTGLRSPSALWFPELAAGRDGAR